MCTKFPAVFEARSISGGDFSHSGPALVRPASTERAKAFINKVTNTTEDDSQLGIRKASGGDRTLTLNLVNYGL